MRAHKSLFVAALAMSLLVACGNAGDKGANKGADKGAAGDKKAEPAKADAEKGDKGAKKDGTEATKDAEGALVVYSARSKKLVGPLIEKFEKASGVKVDVRYGDATGLVTKMRTEGAQSDADVFFAQDLGNLGTMRDSKLLTELPQALVDQTLERYREGSRNWVATSGRVRVLVYSPERVKPEELPKTLKELNDPKWKKRLGWAPRNGSFQVHVSGLRAIWGEEETEAWLKGIKALEPGEYPKNSPQVNAVDKGEIDVGWVNHYYLHKIKAANPGLKAANHSFATDKDAGNLVMLSGAGILKASKRPEQARKFIEFLLSEEAQNYFAQNVYEYPTREGIATHKDVPALTTIKQPDVDQKALTDLDATRKLLQKLGLL